MELLHVHRQSLNPVVLEAPEYVLDEVAALAERKIKLEQLVSYVRLYLEYPNG